MGKGQSTSYTNHTCFFCGKKISSNGFAKVSHYRKHTREGIAIEDHDRGVCEFSPSKSWKQDQRKS